MITDDVTILDVHRSRRLQRLKEGLALNSTDGQRREISQCLAGVASALSADRVAAAFIDDETGGGLQLYCMLDLLSERPRERFDIAPPHTWGSRIPGLWDGLDPHSGVSFRKSSAAACAIGSDGSRSWFVLVDSVNRLGPMSDTAKDDLLFYGGRCAGVLLHTDLEGSAQRGEASGWPLLQDLTGREDDTEASRRIASRFVITRALQVAVEGAEPDQRVAQAQVCGPEVEGLPVGDPEREAWADATRALKEGDRQGMSEAALRMGMESERQLHFGSADTCYFLSSALAADGSSIEVATDAARFRARVFRRQGRWADAEHHYQRARALAQASQDHERHGLILGGMAGLARSRGNLPRTRELLLVQLEIGEREHSPVVVGAAHHDLMALDKLSGDLEGSLIHGWEAVRNHSDLEEKLQALTDLAGVLTELGAYDSAEDGYTIVAARVGHQAYRIHALSGLAYISALRGDRAMFDRRAAAVDELGFQALPEAMQAELLYERGLSYRSLGDDLAAVRWLARARDRSEVWGVNQVLFDAEQAIEEMRGGDAPVTGSPKELAPAAGAAADTIGLGIRDLKEQLV